MAKRHQQNTRTVPDRTDVEGAMAREQSRANRPLSDDDVADSIAADRTPPPADHVQRRLQDE